MSAAALLIPGCPCCSEEPPALCEDITEIHANSYTITISGASGNTDCVSGWTDACSAAALNGSWVVERSGWSSGCSWDRDLELVADVCSGLPEPHGDMALYVWMHFNDEVQRWAISIDFSNGFCHMGAGFYCDAPATADPAALSWTQVYDPDDPSCSCSVAET